MEDEIVQKHLVCPICQTRFDIDEASEHHPVACSECRVHVCFACVKTCFCPKCDLKGFDRAVLLPEHRIYLLLKTATNCRNGEKRGSMTCTPNPQTGSPRKEARSTTGEQETNFAEDREERTAWPGIAAAKGVLQHEGTAARSAPSEASDTNDIDFDEWCRTNHQENTVGVAQGEKTGSSLLSEEGPATAADLLATRCGRDVNTNDLAEALEPPAPKNKLNKKMVFPVCLMDMLDKAERFPVWKEIMSWRADGASFEIHKPKDYEIKIAPHYFEGTNFHHLQLQLNHYTFERLPDESVFAYRHRQFSRHKKAECKSIKRGPYQSRTVLKIKKPKPNGKDAAENLREKQLTNQCGECLLDGPPHLADDTFFSDLESEVSASFDQNEQVDRYDWDFATNPSVSTEQNEPQFLTEEQCIKKRQKLRLAEIEERYRLEEQRLNGDTELQTARLHEIAETNIRSIATKFDEEHDEALRTATDAQAEKIRAEEVAKLRAKEAALARRKAVTAERERDLLLQKEKATRDDTLEKINQDRMEKKRRIDAKRVEALREAMETEKQELTELERKKREKQERLAIEEKARKAAEARERQRIRKIETANRKKQQQEIAQKFEEELERRRQAEEAERQAIEEEEPLLSNEHPHKDTTDIASNPAAGLASREATIAPGDIPDRARSSGSANKATSKESNGASAERKVIEVPNNEGQQSDTATKIETSQAPVCDTSSQIPKKRKLSIDGRKLPGRGNGRRKSRRQSQGSSQDEPIILCDDDEKQGSSQEPICIDDDDDEVEVLLTIHPEKK